MIPVPLWVYGAGAGLILLVGTNLWTYQHGKFICQSEQTVANLEQAKKDIQEAEKNAKLANTAGEKHEEAKTQIVYRNRTITNTVTIPPDSDPYVPVWFARLLDRYPSQSATVDAYPGQSDGDTSDVRLSETRSLLEGWVKNYYTCRDAIIQTRELNPVLPPPPEKPGLLERLGL